ncbi:MAG: signal peptidase II [Oscillospiraceae bacterium]|nr:signal peptidase II [Oscillospiraceae bacterium]
MWYIALFLVFLAADQAVKLWVVQHLALYESAPLLPGFLELRYIQNTGGGWSILSDYTWLLSILTAFIMLVLLYLLLRRIVRHPLGRTACVLLLAGGCGNLIDRLRLGYVVDMFNFQFISYPVFNVADIAVVIGMILAAVYYLFLYEKHDGPERGERHGDAASRQ